MKRGWGTFRKGLWQVPKNLGVSSKDASLLEVLAHA